MGILEFYTPSVQNERKTFFADVLLPLPIPRTFTYRLPADFNELIQPGFRVIVQFGKAKVITGIVVRIHEKPPEIYQAKYILDVLDTQPTVNNAQLKLYNWVASYYMCPVGEVLQAGLPSGLKLNSESKIQLNPTFDPHSAEPQLTNKEALLMEVLQQKQVLAYSEVAKVLHIKSYLPVIRSLIAKEAIILFEEVKEKYNPKKETRVRITSHWNNDQFLEELLNQLEQKPKQQEVVLAYLNHVPVFRDRELNAKGIEKSLLISAGISESSLNTLVKNGVFEIFHRIVPRVDLSSGLTDQFHELSPVQQVAKSQILKLFEQKQTVLLHGITGSGKTEIYIHLIQEVLNQGEQVLFLMPEIALTTQIVSRLQRVFGDKMGVYHSRYSDNERVEVWKGLLQGRFPLIVGVRSSVFLPFDNLGLVIVDEEHEFSYKQFDRAPRYHARDVAQVLAGLHSAKVLMGTATPSLESHYLAKDGKYGYVVLNERYGNAVLPEVIFADILLERKQKTLKGDFTALLERKISNALERNEQIIIFQNRRGYAPYISCDTCGWIPKCQSCAVSLTYHMYQNQLRCHYCGHHERMPVVCPACGSSQLKTVGFGTEKLEEDLKLLFPQARVQRMDLDTTRRKYSYQTIIGDFERGDIDILVGTQMVSKGLNFEGVTLVGIFDIDRMIHYPDFRAAERAFQLAVQVSGRSGRKDKPGEVVIQTANTRNPLLELIANQSYSDFYELEILERQRYSYPPFVRLIRIMLKHQDKSELQRAAGNLFHSLQSQLKGIEFLGPNEPLVSKVRNLYLMEIIVKIPRNSPQLDAYKQSIAGMVLNWQADKEFKKTQVIFDVDPY